MEPLDKFIEAYNWLIRQNGQGVNTPQPRALSNIIKAMFRKDGIDAVQKANRVAQAEKTPRPAIIERGQKVELPGKSPSGPRAERLALRETPSLQEDGATRARLNRLRRVSERTGAPLPKLEEKASVAAVEVETPEPVKRTRKRAEQPESTEPAQPITGDEANRITEMSPKQIESEFGRSRLAVSLLAMDVPAEEIQSRSDRQLAAIIKDKITGA